MPPVVLLAVVALAMSGRAGAGLGVQAASAAPVVAAGAGGASTPTTTRPTVEPSRPRVTPSPRSDWPAAINGRNRTPPPSGAPGAIDWSVIPDTRLDWQTDHRGLPQSRRLGRVANSPGEPFEL